MDKIRIPGGQNSHGFTDKIRTEMDSFQLFCKQIVNFCMRYGAPFARGFKHSRDSQQRVEYTLPSTSGYAFQPVKGKYTSLRSPLTGWNPRKWVYLRDGKQDQTLAVPLTAPIIPRGTLAGMSGLSSPSRPPTLGEARSGKQLFETFVHESLTS